MLTSTVISVRPIAHISFEMFYPLKFLFLDAFNNYVSRVDAGERDFGLAIPCWNILLTHARKLEVLYMHPNHSLLVAEMLMVRDEFIIITNKIIQSYREEDPEIACWRRMYVPVQSSVFYAKRFLAGSEISIVPCGAT